MKTYTAFGIEFNEPFHSCGHKHRTVKGAVRCAEKHRNANGDDTVPANWWRYAVLDSDDNEVDTDQARMQVEAGR
jgi:hypothetical protein